MAELDRKECHLLSQYQTSQQLEEAKNFRPNSAAKETFLESTNPADDVR